MKPKPDEQSEDDGALFRAAIRDVKPLASSARVSTTAPRARPRAKFTRAEGTRVLEEALEGSGEGPGIEAADPSAFAQPGVSAAVLRKLRRGQYRVQAHLDLHGLTVAEAKLQLRDFLVKALQEHLHCVRIVHGKGLRSGARGPVLRQLVNAVLRRSPQVLAFTSARQVDGGTGALYALLDPRL